MDDHFGVVHKIVYSQGQGINEMSKLLNQYHISKRVRGGGQKSQKNCNCSL